MIYCTGVFVIQQYRYTGGNKLDIKTNKISGKQWAAIIFFSFCGALALSMDFNMPELPDEQKVNALTEIIWNFRISLQGTSVSSTLLFAGLAALGARVHRIRKNTKPVRLLILSFLIALVWLTGVSFHINNTLDLLTCSAGQTLKSVCYSAGSTYLIYELGQLLLRFLEDHYDMEIKLPAKLSKLYRKYPFRFSFFAIMLGWLPHLIIAYPGYICYDAWYQLCMFYEKIGFTTHQPPAHTIFLGLFTKLGLAMGHVNWGVYISVILQTLTAALIMAYSLTVMKKLSAPKWLRIISFASMMLVPFYTDYIALEIKDTFYSVFFLLFVTEFICMLEKPEEYFGSYKHILILIVSIVGTMLARNNGKYALYPTVAAFLIYLLFAARKRDKNNFIKPLTKPLICLLLPILFANVISATIIKAYNVEQFGIREAMSLPFQQTARYVSEYKDEVTDEEADAIRALIYYDGLPDIYDPRFADPVKNTFNTNSTTEEFFGYIRVWFKMFFKHPGVYAAATLNQNYYLLYPFVENDGGYDVIYTETVPEGIGGYFTGTVNGDLGISEIEGLQNAKMIVRGIYKSCFSLPIIGLFSHPAPYCIVLLMLILFAANKKAWRVLLAMLPLLLSFGIVIAAPVIQEHPRYTFPIIYSMPVVLAYYLYADKPEPRSKGKKNSRS